MQENKKMKKKKGYAKGGSGRTISDADRARIAKILGDESGRTISDADRARIAPILLGESGKTISDADRARIAQRMKRKGGGSAMKKKKGYAKGGATRIF
tara:strand:+ start:366 stop:662 length:297 start_codon:yes stop_codon:yes gene_type:complete